MSGKQTLGTFEARTSKRVRRGDDYVEIKFAGDVTVVVDVEALARKLAPKALTSKRHTSTLCNGAIIARASQVTQDIGGRA